MQFGMRAEDLRTDPGVVYFVKCAKDYVALIERIMAGEVVTILEVSKTLAILYAAGFGLPDPELPEHDVFPNSFNMTTDDWFKIFGAMGNWFHAELAKLKLEPAELESTILSHVDDDLADIYRDLKAELLGWETGNSAYDPEIVFEWKFSFETHWGFHAVNTLSVMHDLAWKTR